MAPVAAALEIAVLALDASPAQLARWRSWLSPHECARADRYVQAPHGARYIAAHGQLRALLAQRLDCSPADLAFDHAAHGKPMVAGGGWQFNLSHSGPWGLVGLHPTLDLGVDIECIATPRPWLALARRFFTPTEAAMLATLPEESIPATFCRLWTCKEAWMKATGRGLAAGAANLEVTLAPPATRMIEPAHPERRWWVHECAHGATVAAIVAPQAPTNIVMLPPSAAAR